MHEIKEGFKFFDLSFYKEMFSNENFSRALSEIFSENENGT